MLEHRTPLIVLMEDEIIHTQERPFCFVDPACPCHEEDQEAIEQVYQWVQDGLLTEQEATLFVAGKTL